MDVRSTVTHLSGSWVVSRHVAWCRDRTIADVEMTSVFVRRRAEGMNRSIDRVWIDGQRRLSPSYSSAPPVATGRGDTFQDKDVAAEERDIGVMVVEPYATSERRAVFHANTAAGDDLTVQIMASREGVIRRHRALLHASSDGKLLAEVVTRRLG